MKKILLSLVLFSSLLVSGSAFAKVAATLVNPKIGGPGVPTGAGPAPAELTGGYSDQDGCEKVNGCGGCTKFGGLYYGAIKNTTK